MAKSTGLIRKLIAACFLSAAAYSVIGLEAAWRHWPTGISSGPRQADFVAAGHNWVDEFERFAARRSQAEIQIADTTSLSASAQPSVSAQSGRDVDQAIASGKTDRDSVIVAKRASDSAQVLTGSGAEALAPRDMPKSARRSTADDPMLTTGSVPTRQPLLPPVPGPETFKALKADRLGRAMHDGTNPVQTMPVELPNSSSGASPHAELAPGTSASVPGKSAQLSTPRTDKAGSHGANSPILKPTGEPTDVLIQAQLPKADPSVDPDAPVLGYAEQLATAEAPFKALFSVTPQARHAWLDVNAPKPAARKVAKVAVMRHKHRIRHDG